MSDVSEHKAIVVAAITPTQDCHCSPPFRRRMSRTPPRGEIRAGTFSLRSCAGLSGFGATLACLLHLALIAPEAPGGAQSKAVVSSMQNAWVGLALERQSAFRTARWGVEGATFAEAKMALIYFLNGK